MRAMENEIKRGTVTERVSCGSKVAYSQGGISRALGALRKRKHRRTRAYHCRFCNHYHLTRVGAR